MLIPIKRVIHKKIVVKPENLFLTRGGKAININHRANFNTSHLGGFDRLIANLEAITNPDSNAKKPVKP